MVDGPFGGLYYQLTHEYSTLSWTRWEGIGLDFIEGAKKELLQLLAKKAVYAYPSEPKAGFPTLTFSLSNKNNLNEKYNVNEGCPLEMKEYFIGYVSPNLELIVLVDGKEFNIPFKLGRTIFFCQLAQKRYLIEVIVEQVAEGKGFLVKGTILREEMGKCLNLTEELITDNSECEKRMPCGAEIKPIYYSFSNTDNLPLEVSVHSYLPNQGLISTGLLENKETLGYAGDVSYMVIKLNGQELEILNNTEIVQSTGQYFFSYSRNEYSLCSKTHQEHDKKLIHLAVEKLIPVMFNYQSMSFYKVIHVGINCGKGMEASSKWDYYAKKGSQIQLTVNGRVVNNVSLHKESCHYFTYKQDGIVYMVKVSIRKHDGSAEHYKVDLELEKKLDGQLVLVRKFCESEIVGNPVEYTLTDSSKTIASDLNLAIVLDRIFPQSPLQEGCIGYGNEDSIVRIFLGSRELGQFRLDPSEADPSIEFEKDGKSYSIDSKTVFEGNRWHIVLDIHQVQEGWSLTTLMDWFK